MINYDHEILKSNLIEDIEREYRPLYYDGNYLIDRGFIGKIGNITAFVLHYFNFTFEEYLQLPLAFISHLIDFINKEPVDKVGYDFMIKEYEKKKREMKTIEFDKYLLRR